ncbi:MAG: hypothetical protein KA401_03085 [Anaerolineae bacterium]|nr:hypothetical protein [Chloroflexota bacterium]MBP6298306.1 hypothetical protein [Anaerolineae bacterium]
MPRTEKLFHDLDGENRYGVLLMAQLDAVPETLQLVIATTQEDEQSGGLRDMNQYLVRAIGVTEHRLSLGLFKTLAKRETHPLLYQYNTAAAGVFFRGTPDDPHALFADILQAYAGTFGPWRQPPTYLNTSRPLLSLLTSGGDLLGQMPEPLATAMVQALDAHGLESRTLKEETSDVDEHGRSRHRKVLLMDDAYVVAFDFTVEFFGRA